MSRKVLVIIVIFIVGFFGFVLFSKNTKPTEALIGVKHEVQKADHISEGQQHAPYNSDPASSGPHYDSASAPAEWGVYTQEVKEEIFLHNLEHGGVVITYSPDIIQPDQQEKLQTLFAPPYRNKEFKPTRAILTPRAKNTKAIQLASWGYTLSLDQFDEAKIIKFYLQHSGKAPEAGAGPLNKPIDQTKEKSE